MPRLPTTPPLRWVAVAGLIWLFACSSAQAAAPTASLTITASSPRVSGNIGEGVAGVSVGAELLRRSRQASAPPSGYVPVASGSATTQPDGSWSLSLAPAHGPLGSDQIALSYSTGSAPGGTPLPDDFSSQPFYFGAYISADGSTISVAGGACPSFTVVVDSVAHPTAPNGRYCSYQAPTRVSDQDHVRVAYTTAVGSAGTIADVTSIADAGLLGGPGEAASCHADLVFRNVVCEDLSGGSFAVSRDGSTPTPLRSTLVSSTDFGPVYAAEAHIPDLASGGTLTLDETSPTPTTRHLATLHVASLRIDAAASGAVSGTCQPGEDLFGYAFATGSASFGGVCAGDGSVSRSGSFSAAGFGAWFAYQDDDIGSGTTLVNLPALVSAAPQPNASMSASGWDAYAALSGPPNPYHPGSPAATPAEVLAATSRLSLAIAPAAGTSPVFSSDAALGSDTQGAFGGVRVGALPVGRYTANWTLTDGHGDTQQFESLFFAQPDPGGPGGSTGVSARKHISSLMRCVRKAPRHRGHGPKERSCTVIVRAPWARLVTVVISRHRTTFARGRARVKAGRARVSMRNLRRLGSGSYEVTITASAGVTRRVVRRTLHL